VEQIGPGGQIIVGSDQAPGRIDNGGQLIRQIEFVDGEGISLASGRLRTGSWPPERVIAIWAGRPAWAKKPLGCPLRPDLSKNLMFALLGKRLAIGQLIVDDPIREEDFHRIAICMFNTDLNGVTLKIGLWQGHSHIEDYGDSLALIGACHFLK